MIQIICNQPANCIVREAPRKVMCSCLHIPGGCCKICSSPYDGIRNQRDDEVLSVSVPARFARNICSSGWFTRGGHPHETEFTPACAWTLQQVHEGAVEEQSISYWISVLYPAFFVNEANPSFNIVFMKYLFAWKPLRLVLLLFASFEVSSASFPMGWIYEDEKIVESAVMCAPYHQLQRDPWLMHRKDSCSFLLVLK